MPTVWRGFIFLGGGSSEQWCRCADVGSNFYVGFPNFLGGAHSSEECELAGSAVLRLLWIRSVSPFVSPSSS
jgi:hypothetical protein